MPSSHLEFEISSPEVNVAERGSSVPMCPEDLRNALERVLVERFCDWSAVRTGGLLTAARTALQRICPGDHRTSSNSSKYSEVADRLSSLPEPVRELLRRRYVFLESENCICLSTNMTLKQFQRLQGEAVDYVLMRRRHRSGATEFDWSASSSAIPRVKAEE